MAVALATDGDSHYIHVFFFFFVCGACHRLTVWENVDTATEFWIKGKQFNIPHLLHDDHIASNPAFDSGCSL